MTKTKSVRLPDVLALLRLSHELHEVKGDRAGRARHLLESLNDLVGAQVSFLLDVQDFHPAGQPRCLGWEHAGYLSEEGWQVISSDPMDNVDSQGPVVTAVFQSPETRCTRLRQQAVPDNVWYRSDFAHNLNRVMGIDSVIFAKIQVDPGGRCMLIGLHRGFGDRQFGERELTLIDLVGREFDWFFRSLALPPVLIGLRPADCGVSVQGLPEAGEGLSRQLRRTLERLLAGDSEKEAAYRLGLSPHTVHDYVKRLHKLFGVSSRSELLVKCLDVAGVHHYEI